MNPRVEELIRRLDLQPHPEGGWYREVFRAGQTVRAVADASGAERSALTAIYFLLASGTRSRWHRLAVDEVWSHVSGEPLDLWLWRPGEAPAAHLLADPGTGGGEGIRTVPAGVWQAAEPRGEYALVCCAVGPGFEFRDLLFAADDPAAAGALRERGLGRLL